VYMVNRLLQKLGYRVSAYERADEALNALRSDPLSFDLVVTDYNMPGPSGLDVAREVAQLRSDLPVVITSGYITDTLRDGARLLGVRHLIYKPNTVDELCTIIQRILVGGEGATT
jgi:two-component system, cell cycle sensor histidine kinase and response regulator CckA